MKQAFIIQNNTPLLTLFFAGWGMDEHPFLPIASDNDVMICYDYRSLYFDAAPLRPYSRVRVVAWSMGVWAASRVLSGTELPVAGKTAVNGTPFPVDNRRGIPEDIVNGTWKQLNDVNLQKFYRRMCDSSAAYSDFAKHAPKRPLNEIKEELKAIREISASVPCGIFLWDTAYIGTNDRIFSSENQQNAWNNGYTRINEISAAHYNPALLATLIASDKNNMI